ncbi:MAG: hypothetical protein ACI4KM_01280 [Oscillospiraceae bacterium]
MPVIIIKSSCAQLFNGEIFPRCDTVCAASASSIDLCDGIVVFGEQCTDFPSELNAFAAIISDSSIDCARALCGCGIPVITCGMSLKSTVSASSSTAEQLTLSLNRTVPTINGCCEPMEFPLTPLQGISLYDHMAAFAAAIIAGLIEQ